MINRYFGSWYSCNPFICTSIEWTQWATEKWICLKKTGLLLMFSAQIQWDTWANKTNAYKIQHRYIHDAHTSWCIHTCIKYLSVCIVCTLCVVLVCICLLYLPAWQTLLGWQIQIDLGNTGKYSQDIFLKTYMAQNQDQTVKIQTRKYASRESIPKLCIYRVIWL
jgi:hypothetical protein